MAPPVQVQGRDHLAPQDHGRARHRGAPRARRTAASRSRCSNRTIDLRVSVAADDLRREDRDANPRQDATSTSTSRSSGSSRRPCKDFARRDREPLRHGARHRTDRLGQDHLALLGAVADQHARSQRDDRRGPGRVQPRRHQPGAGQRGRRPHASPRRSRRSCARTPTSSWSARSATSTPPRSPSRRRSPATWCSPRSTPTTRPSAIGRLIDMGIEPFLVASSVNLVLGPAAGARGLRALPAADQAHRRDPARAAARSRGGGGRERSSRARAAWIAATPAIAGARACTRSWR